MEENAESLDKRNGAATPELPVDAVIVGLFAASGCAALVYEIVWFHLLRLVIGASALSMGIVLASFMGGMFLGSLLVSRVVPRRWDPLRVYGTIEIGIGLMGLLMPVLVPAARAVYFGLFGYGVLGIAVRAAVAGVMLLPPTALMGATLPAIARRFSDGPEGMTRLAFLYGANTIGAVTGCIVTGFYLLPNWDVLVATGAAAAVNFAIGGVAWWLASLKAYRAEGPAPSAATAVTPKPYAVYVVACLSGMTALGAQVAWTRLLSVLFGGTTYTFAIILGVFLAGLGIGSAIAAGAIRRGNSARLLATSQVGLVAAIFYAATMISKVIPFTSTLRVVPIDTLHVLHTIHCIEVILPAAILWGMSFPLAMDVAGSGRGDAGRTSGDVYAANTIGAIAGALGVTFVVIPNWGTRGSQQLLMAVSAISGLLAALHYIGDVANKDESGKTRSDALGALAVAAVASIVGIQVLPGLSPLFQANGRYLWDYNPYDPIPYWAEGVASTVAVRENSGTRFFHVAGKVEASTNAEDLRLERLLGHLSALAHPKPESVLVVGLGAGITAGTFVLHPEVKRIVICEIEPRVVKAAGYFSDWNYSVLSDPRVQVIHDDARHFLATTSERFDIITSDPIHPWVRGNSVLFSREYYGIVKERLKPGGLATQWVPLYETNEAAIQIQMRTFMDAFPNGTVWNSQEGGKGYDVVVLGQVDRTRLDVEAIQRRIDDNPKLRKSLSEVKLGSAVDLLASYAVGAADMAGWYKDTAVNRDFSLKLEYISGLALNAQVATDIFGSMVRARSYPTDLFVAPPARVAELKRRIMAGSSPSP
jgi:spermidine synthase